MNVVLVLIDTLRRDHLGPYAPAPPLPTPAFDRLAALGVTFDRYFLGSYPCMPARRDLWTGRYEFPWRGWGPLLAGDRDLPSAAAAAGATAMLITDHYHLFQPGAGNYHFGFDGWEFIRGQEDDHWATRPVSVPWPAEPGAKLHRRWERYWRNTADRRDGLRWRSEEDTFAARTFAAACRWLKDNAAPAGGAAARPPFFLLVDCFDPHEPFDPPSPYREAAGAPEGAIPWPIYGPASRYSQEDLAGIRALYAGEVALVDAQFGRLLQTLEDLGRLDDTVILTTTDHGHLFGEHGMIGKPSSTHGDSNLYRPLAHVPLLAYHPETRGAALRCTELAQTVDLYPTVLDALGAGVPEGWRPQGRSLLPWLRGRGGGGAAGPLRSHACYAKFGEAIQITDGDLVLHCWPPGEANGPLYWYGPEEPAFLRPRGVGAWEPVRSGMGAQGGRNTGDEAGGGGAGAGGAGGTGAAGAGAGGAAGAGAGGGGAGAGSAGGTGAGGAGRAGANGTGTGSAGGGAGAGGAGRGGAGGAGARGAGGARAGGHGGGGAGGAGANGAAPGSAGGGAGRAPGHEDRMGRYPIDWVRGPCRTVLLDASEDRDLSAERPADVRRLRAALAQWLVETGAPPEQRQRLGL